jgi:hypothetical protein
MTANTPNKISISQQKCRVLIRFLRLAPQREKEWITLSVTIQAINSPKKIMQMPHYAIPPIVLFFQVENRDWRHGVCRTTNNARS